MDKVIDTGTRDLLKGENMWPEKRTAFLIIHGIGEQNPFETLDAFVRGFYKVLEKKNNGKNIAIEHRIKHRTGDDKIEWVENFISLVKEDRTKCPIDFYEYYWAHRMEREITFQELVDWLIKTSDGAKKFYHENAQIVKEYEGKKDDAFKGGEFKNYWYLKHLGLFLRFLTILPSVILKIVPKIPYIGSILEFIRPVIKVLFSKVTKTFVEYMGDVAIYTTTDVKSKHYNIRKLILYDSFKQVEALIKDKDIENIIIVGHSLGSVIAYDTINRINYLINSINEETDKEAINMDLANKIKGFITFGSPLDKTAFFFREHTSKEQYVRRQILSHFHSFKIRDLDLSSYFCLDEFKPPFTVKKLCKAIKNDNYKISLQSAKNTITWLNELLKEPKFYSILREKKPAIVFTKKVIDLVNKTDGYRNNKEFSKLELQEQINIKRLNRLLLEETYPQKTPKILQEIVGNPIKPLLDSNITWINFWDEKDPVSGNLDFYVVYNIPLVMGKEYGISHTAYWEYEEMYSKICEHFLR